MIAILMAVAGLLMRYKGITGGNILFWTGLVIYLVNRIAFYTTMRRNGVGNDANKNDGQVEQ